VIPTPLVGAHLARIAEFAARNRLPAMGWERGFVAAGGLISYGGDFLEAWRLAARYVDISKHAGRVNDESILVDEIAA